MKPDGGVSENSMESVAEVEPGEFFVEIGTLVLESRLPAQSVKGRQDGPHCPPAIGDRSFHICDAREPLCKKASEMQRQMQTLWRNRIPMCIEVLLFPDCVHGLQRATATDAAPPAIGDDGCVLLERWTIQMATKKFTENCISSKALLQAMRSYLHFSQLSAWLNLTHGMQPRHIGYRISPPAEFCTSTFGKTPDSHLFPLASANKATSVKVTLLHLPRLPEIPKPLCSEMTGKQRCSAVYCLASCFAPSSSPWPLGLLSQAATQQHQQRSSSSSSSSPKLDKPNVLHALSAEEREMLTRSSKCPCSECLGNSFEQCVATVTQLEEDPELKFPDGLPRSSPDFFAEVSESPQSIVKDSKHLLLKLIPEEILATQHPHSPQHSKTGNGDNDDAKTSARKQSTLLKCSISTLQPPFMDHCNDLIPEVLPSSRLFLDGDSSGSSPDFDHFLSKTLMKQSEPLTLDEMETYLYHLYLPNSSDVSRSSAIGAYGTVVRSGKLKPRHSLDGKLDGKSVFCEDDSAEAKLPLNLPEENKDFGAENLDFRTEPNSSHLFLRTQANAVTKISPIDGTKDGIGMLSLLPKLTEKSRRAAPPCDDKTDSCHPVFTVGDPAENEKRAGCRETAIASPVTPSHRLSASEEEEEKVEEEEEVCSQSAIVHGDDVNRVRQSPPQTLRKSTSCPSKPAFRNGVSSLLRTVMKKELMAGQSATISSEASSDSRCVPLDQETVYFRRCVQKSACRVFHSSTGLPLQSSPVPAKKLSSGNFDYDCSLNCVRAIKNSLSCFDLDSQNDDETHLGRVRRSYSTSAPASTNCLLGSFEESLINGRIEPAGVVNGFTVDIGASGSFCPPHLTLPVTAFFFSLSDDHAPSPYLGHIDLESHSKRGYHIPKQGTIQVTLFNPNKTVVKMFVVKYDLSDMPPNHQTVLRQRTLYMPVKGSPSDAPGFMVYLRYLIHLRFASSKTSKIYLHTDIRVIFARDKFELDSRVASYELRSFTEGPENPKFSPRK